MAQTKVSLVDLNANELILDLDGDTSLHSSTDDQIDIKIAGADDFTFTPNAFNILASSHATFADSSEAKFGAGTDLQIYHDGTNSYIANKTGALKIATETSGIAITLGHTTSEVTIADNLTVTGNATISGSLTFPDGGIAIADLDIDGGTDIGAAIVDADLFIVDDGAGGTNRKTVASRLLTYAMAGTLSEAAQTNITSLGTLTALTVDNISINTSTVTASADLIFDAAADIVLNADGGKIKLEDGAVTFGQIFNSSGLHIISKVSDQDIVFKGNDGGSEITALTLDMSAAGAATFSGTIDSGAITSTGIVTGTAFTAGSAVLAEAELELLDGLTAGTAIASKVVTTDANIDTTGQRNLTISGELDAATGDFSGAVDVAGALTTAAITASGIVTGTAFTAGSAVLAEAELELLDGLTAGTAIASKVVTTDANIDTTGQRNLTISGEIDAATGDFSGAVDIAGALVTHDDFTLTGAATGAVWDSSNNSLDFADSTQLRFGASADLKIYHDGSNSHIVDSGTGNLIIQTSALQIMNAAGSENILLGTQDGAVTIYNNNIAMYNTSATENVFNEASNDVDFRVESNGNANMLFVDGGNNYVCIGTASDLGATLNVSGNGWFKNADNSDNLTLESTDADASNGPRLRLYRNSGSPLDNDVIGDIRWEGKDNGGNDVGYAKQVVTIHEEADGSEQSMMQFFVALGGSLVNVLTLDRASATFNEGSNDIDFRVESNGNTHALFVDAGNNRIGIGTASPDYTLDVRSMGSPSTDTVINIEGGATDANCGLQFTNSAGSLRGRIMYDTDDNNLQFIVNTAEKMRILTNGDIAIGQTDSQGNTRLLVAQEGQSVSAGHFRCTHASYDDDVFKASSNRASNSGFHIAEFSANNEADPKCRVRGDGALSIDGGSLTTGGADYAEYFEWKDGNSSSEDRRGYSVVLDGNQIVKATDSDDTSNIIGVISSFPVVIGDAQPMVWKEKYELDIWGSRVWEDYTQTEWTIVEEGKDNIYHSYQTDKIPTGVTAPDDAVVTSKEKDGTTNLKREKLNSSYDSSATYIPREDRKEWDAVGLMGKLRIRKGQPTGTNWIKMRDISDTVEEWLVR